MFGGAPGIHNLGLIESALYRLQSGYYADLNGQAAALWERLSTNYSFVDGNKQVSFAAIDLFLGLNGAWLEAEPQAVIDFTYSYLEAGTSRKPALEAWLRAQIVPFG